MATVDVVAVAVRALAFIAALQAAGAPLFLWLFGSDLSRAGPSVAALARRSAWFALLATAASQAMVPAQLVGNLRGVFDAPLQLALLASDVGTANAIRLLGLAMIVYGSLKSTRDRAAIALIGATLAVASFAFMGHTATDDGRWYLAALLIVHLSIVAFWFGSLLPLDIVGRHESVQTNGAVVERFSVTAVWLVPFIFVAGFAMSLALLPSFSALWTPYGTLLLAKIAGFAVLMGFASVNKWRFGPALAAGDTGALRGLRLSIRTEWTLIAGILAVTATMTALFSPDVH